MLNHAAEGVIPYNVKVLVLVRTWPNGSMIQRPIKLSPSGPLSLALAREVEATALLGLASALSDYQRGEKLLAEGTFLAAAEDLSKAAKEMSDWMSAYHSRFDDGGLQDFRPYTVKVAGLDLVLSYDANVRLSQFQNNDSISKFRHIAEAEQQTCAEFMRSEQITTRTEGRETLVTFRPRWKGEQELRGNGGTIAPNVLDELRHHGSLIRTFTL